MTQAADTTVNNPIPFDVMMPAIINDLDVPWSPRTPKSLDRGRRCSDDGAEFTAPTLLPARVLPIAVAHTLREG
jgi:hypothetical protein